MKKIVVLILFALVLGALPSNTIAFSVPGKTIDQACTEISQGTVFVNMSVVGTIQIFFPTMDILDAAAARISATPGKTVDVRAVVYNTTSQGMLNFAESTNTVTVTDTPSWQVFEMDDIPIPSDGDFSFMVYSVNRSDEVIWYAKDSGDCYPNGYPIIDSNEVMNEDFNFVIYGKNAGGSAMAPTDSADPDTITNGSTSLNTTSSNTASTPNKQSADSKAFLSNPKAQEQFTQEMKDAILADFKRENPKGIFGIGGFMGDILTWTNVIIFFSIVVFIIVITLILRLRKKPESI